MRWWDCGCRCFAYQPAALDRADDSINGVSTQGFGSSSWSMFAILIGGSDVMLNKSTQLGTKETGALLTRWKIGRKISKLQP